MDVAASGRALVEAVRKVVVVIDRRLVGCDSVVVSVPTAHTTKVVTDADSPTVDELRRYGVDARVVEESQSPPEPVT